VAGSDDDTATLEGSLADLDVEVLDDLRTLATDTRVLELVTHVLDVLLEEVRLSDLSRLLARGQLRNFLVVLHVVRVALHVRVDHEGTEVSVDLLIRLVLHHLYQVETRQDGVRQTHVVVEV
jgi:hypothetical protein